MKAIKILLGIIAVNLTLITLIQLEIFPPKAYANEINTSTIPINTNYGLVPLNEDGSLNLKFDNEQLKSIFENTNQIQEVQIVGYDKNGEFNKVKVQKGKLFCEVR
jgi:hypothetical protein